LGGCWATESGPVVDAAACAMCKMLLVLPLLRLLNQMGRDEIKYEEVMHKMSSELKVQEKLLNALVPRHVAKQIQTEDNRQLAETYEDAAVVFLYLPDFGHVMTAHGTNSAVTWLSLVYRELDGLVSEQPWRTRIIKTETFSNFFMVVCTADTAKATSSAMTSRNPGEVCVARRRQARVASAAPGREESVLQNRRALREPVRGDCRRRVPAVQHLWRHRQHREPHGVHRAALQRRRHLRAHVQRRQVRAERRVHVGAAQPRGAAGGPR